MEPDIKDESLIFVDKSKKDIDNKGIYLINTIDGIFVKKINIKNNRFYMRSNNTIYDDIELNNFDILGKVCGVMIKL